MNEKIKKAMERQQAILDASKKAGREALSAEDQREFDELQAEIDAARAEENAEAVRAAERQRISEISELGRTFNVDVTSFINDGSTIDAARAGILEALRKHQQPNSSITITEDEGDKFRNAAADALCMRAGIPIAKPSEGANDLRGYSLRNLAIECLVREGNGSYNDLLKMDADTLLRQFYNPTSAFQMILDNSVKKSIVEKYKLVPSTFEKITSKGTLTDFKETKDHEYALGNFSEMKVVPENGELEADQIEDKILPTRKLETRGMSFSMTRQAFINDDIGFIAKLPEKFAFSDKMTIELEVYRNLVNNPKIFDNKTLFHADHNNLITTGTGITVDSLKQIITLGKRQVDEFGKPIIWLPRYIITGIGYEFDIKTILHSTHLPGTNNNDINPLAGSSFEHIESPVLDSLVKSGATPWFVSADPMFSRGIQVDYLNGVETPTVRRSEKAGTLGFVWDVWHDWKVNVLDYRGFIKNPGVSG